MSYSMAELDRRIANIAQVGRVIEIDSAKMRARVQIGDLNTAMIPVSQAMSGAIRIHWMPSVGEQVMVYAPSGEMAAAVIQGAVPQTGSAVADDEQHPTIDLGNAELVITGNIKITGDIEIIGTVTVTEDVVADGVSLVTHTHGGVVSGGSNTAEPNK